MVACCNVGWNYSCLNSIKSYTYVCVFVVDKPEMEFSRPSDMMIIQTQTHLTTNVYNINSMMLMKISTYVITNLYYFRILKGISQDVLKC